MKYLIFREVPKGTKTKYIQIFNTSERYMGHISYFNYWRRYCFWPESDRVFDVNCLHEIIKKIDELMEERVKK